MAANKFATMLHRNTHKIAVILIYAVLEWILIMFLLLNSSFTYLITRFANYFGLKPPCLWCSRVDHIFESANNITTSYRDLVCETHATEISRLSYCSNHQKLAETQNMCNQCLGSQIKHDDECIEMTQQTFAFVSWLSTHQLEKGDEVFRCSCCGESLIRKLYPPCLLLKSSSWSASDYTQTGNVIIEAMDDDNSGGECKVQKRNESQEIQSENDNGEECDNDKDVADEFQILSDIDSFGLTETAEENCSRSVSNLHYEEKEAYEGEKADTNLAYYSCDGTIVRCCSGEDDFLKIINLGSEVNIDSGFNRVIPVELIDSSTTANQGPCNIGDKVLRKHEDESETFDSELRSQIQAIVLAEAQLTKMDDCTEKTRYKELESLVIGVVEAKDPSVPQDLVSDSEACEQVIINQADQTLSIDGNNVGTETMSKPVNSTEETNGSDFTADQTKSKNLDSTEEVNHAADQTQTPESNPSLPCIQEDQSDMGNPVAEVYNTTEGNLAQNYLDQKHAETEIMQVKMNLIDKNQDGDDEKFPDTPTSIESLQCLLKKQLLFEKREPGPEDSLDGRVVSEMEGSDPIQTIERLRTALKAEQKTLSALYAELEEERSASAIATNQTMAMITRLQEEKAAMQMEALQYQRMMEEQSEYDQEALQLLNELMGKREREKQELEKQLEIYHKKVLDYEAKEKIRMMRRSITGSVRSRNSSANSEDSDELSVNLNRKARDEDGSLFSHPESCGGNITPGDAVLNLEEMALDCVKNMTALDDSLTEFEEERLSILDQLKMLEDKLVTLGDDEFMEDLKSIQQPPQLVFNDFDDNCCSRQKETRDSNGVSKDRLYPERKTMVSMAKQLLPFLDAADNETEGLTFEEQVEFQSVEMNKSSLSMTELDSKKLAIEEEVDHVYERLQALEADREFLKHCMSSIQKGDKGMDLLQEILQHLRDLRAVELRVQNMSGDTSG